MSARALTCCGTPQRECTWWQHRHTRRLRCVFGYRVVSDAHAHVPSRRYASGSAVSDVSGLSVNRRHRILKWVVTSALGHSNPLRHVHTVLSNDFHAFRIAMFELYDNAWYVAVPLAAAPSF